MIAALLLTLLGDLLIWVAFQVTGTAGVALAMVGVLLLWCAFLALVKRFGGLG